MHQSIKTLFKKAKKPSKRIIGLMSGTSLDGLDIALCTLSGSGFNTVCKLEEFITVPYNTGFKTQILSVFSKENVSLQKICLLNPWIANMHAEMILQTLKSWAIKPDTIDFIASHGQTIYHAPKTLHQFDTFPNATLQLGDGDHIAHNTGIITLSDFRQKHLAAGGEGAPLALYGDFLLFRSPKVNRVLLNMGGISNFTYIPANGNLENTICSDIGPGNTIMDAYMQRYFNLPFDKDSHLAKQGQCNIRLLNALLNHPFFKQKVPKTTGPELFNLSYLEHAQNASNTQSLSPEIIMCTLAHFTVKSIINTLNTHLQELHKTEIYISGGGVYNTLIMELLNQHLSVISINTTQALGINPDAKEAILFAVLANEAVAGESNVYGTKTYPWVSMGKISFPN